MSSDAVVKASPTPELRLPHANTLMNAAKLALKEDKPILFDYWHPSLQKAAIIGVKGGGNEKLLVKSSEEYTSNIANIYKVEQEFLVVTENSIYLVDAAIDKKLIG